jgi:CRISPR-associated endonuclease Cas1
MERAREWTQPHILRRKDGEIVIADGYGINVRVNRGRLHVTDGIGRERRERTYSRGTDEVSRLVILGGSGALSLEAMRWLDRVGASLVCIDRDGTVLLTSAPTKAEAKIRRAQALAPYNDAGRRVTTSLLARKVEGQCTVVRRLDSDPYPRSVLDRAVVAIAEAQTIEDAVRAEAEAAAAYWSAWRDVEIRFRPSDKHRIPDDWRRFGTRTSKIGSGPRLAVNPGGAILNYLYALLEAETRLACVALGLDPALAIVHADVRGRDSLPLDLMEAVRPSVDRYLLALLSDRVFHASDFHQTGRGSCRLLAPLTHELAETMPAWRRLVGPIAESVASMLVETHPKLKRLPTPLSEANRRADRARRRGGRVETAKASPPRPQRRCNRCGGELPHSERVYCDACLPRYQREQYDAYAKAGVARLAALRQEGNDPSHGGAAAERRGATQARRQRERLEWEQSGAAVSIDPEKFTREILPGIQHVPLSQLMRATGLSLRYVSEIRQGAKVPHVRHWSAFAEISNARPIAPA